MYLLTDNVRQKVIDVVVCIGLACVDGDLEGTAPLDLPLVLSIKFVKRADGLLIEYAPDQEKKS